MSRADDAVKHWQNLPISNPKPDLLNINVLSLVKIPWHLLKISSGNENMGVSWADNSIKIWWNCPLAIPNQISTISMHIPSLVKIHWFTQVIIQKQNTDRQMDVRLTDGWMDGQIDTQMSNVKPKFPTTIVWRGKKSETIIPSHNCMASR